MKSAKLRVPEFHKNFRVFCHRARQRGEVMYGNVRREYVVEIEQYFAT